VITRSTTRAAARSLATGIAAAIAMTMATLAILPGSVAESRPMSAQSTPSPADDLLATYAPVIAVRDQPTECEAGEPYLPMSVEDLFAVPGLILRGPDGQAVDAPTVEDLAGLAGGEDWHIDIPGSALSPACSYEQLYDSIGAAPVTYGRVATDAAHPDSVVVQYWFFYLYNDWNDRHEGDWEMIQILFDAADAQAALDTEPVQVMYAQHEGGELSAWEGGPLQRRDDTHPVVFVAEGSHASYFSSEGWFGKSAQSGFGCDDTRAPIDYVSPTVVRLDDDAPWLAFNGRWGEKQPSFNNGPTGPATKSQWASPVTWVDDEGRVGAVELPSEGSFATTAFCSVVRVGSVAFLRFLDSPVRVVLVVAALVVAIVLAVRQTRWRGASLIPVVQRRRAGQHLGAAIALTRAHLGLFAPIGMLLPVAGLVAAGVHGMLERHTEVGDGLELVGAGSVWGSIVALLTGLAIITAATSVVYVAVATAIRALASGDAPPSWSRALAGARDHPRGVAAELLTRALTNTLVVTVILIPLALWLLARWAVVAAASLESPHPARRSAELTRGRRRRTGALAALVTGLSIAIPALTATLLLVLTGWSFIFVNLIVGLVGAVVIPVAAATMALLHGDLVTEGTEVIDASPRG
jgi:hypothetical protein